MSSMRVAIGGPFKVTAEMLLNIQQVLEIGRLSPGPFVAEFERRFAAYHNVSHAVMSNSGTSALVVALQTLKEIQRWKDGSEVIVPAITFVATVNAVLHCGLVPVLVDVTPDCYTIDVSQIIAAITSKTVAVVPVHTFGLPVDMLSIIGLVANSYGLKIIEDSCEALGATSGGVKVGSFGHMGCFSFYMSHHITAGVGGMTITDRPLYDRKMRSLVNHGWERETPPMDLAAFDFDEIRKRYHFTSIGHSFRATELEAAIALPQLDTLDENLGRRVDNAKILSAGLKEFSDKLQLPKCPYNRSHALMMYPIVVRKGDKWNLIAHLEKNGIETREMLPLTNQPCYKAMFNENDYPIAKWINQQGFYIGCSQYLTDEHMGYVVDRFREYYK